MNPTFMRYILIALLVCMAAWSANAAAQDSTQDSNQGTATSAASLPQDGSMGWPADCSSLPSPDKEACEKSNLLDQLHQEFRSIADEFLARANRNLTGSDAKPVQEGDEWVLRYTAIEYRSARLEESQIHPGEHKADLNCREVQYECRAADKDGVRDGECKVLRAMDYRYRWVHTAEGKWLSL